MGFCCAEEQGQPTPDKHARGRSALAAPPLVAVHWRQWGERGSKYLVALLRLKVQPVFPPNVGTLSDIHRSCRQMALWAMCRCVCVCSVEEGAGGGGGSHVAATLLFTQMAHRPMVRQRGGWRRLAQVQGERRQRARQCFGCWPRCRTHQFRVWCVSAQMVFPSSSLLIQDA